MSSQPDDTRIPSALWLLGAAVLAFDLWLATSPPIEIPYLRELYFVGVATGRESLDWQFLHRPTLEHVMPLPMAMGALLAKLTGIAGMSRVVNVLLLALTAWTVLSAAARIRGRVVASDAAVVLLCLGPAHVFSFVSGFNLQLVLSSSLFTLAIAAAAVGAGRWLWGGAVALLLLPLTGVSGVLSLGAAWPALALAAYRGRAKALALPLGASLLLGLYYFPWSRLAESHARVVSPLRLASELLAAAFGAAGSRSYPWSLLVVAGFVLGSLWVTRSRNWLAFAMLGQLLIALAIGYGRSQYDNALAFTERYVELATPWLVFAHLGFARAERDRGPRLSFALAACALGASLANANHAVRRVREAEAGLRAFSGDARAGLSLNELVDRHGQFLYPFDRGVLLSGLTTLMIEPRPPFDRSPTGGLLSLEAREGPCASELVSWVKLRGRGDARFEHRPERAVDGFAPSEWRASEERPGVLELELRETRPVGTVCLLPGALRGDGPVRVEAWSQGALLAHASGAFAEGFTLFPLGASGVDRVKVHVPKGQSIAELRLAP